MKRLILLLTGVTMALSANGQEFNIGRQLKTQADSVSYALGVYTGKIIVESAKYYDNAMTGDFSKASFDEGIKRAMEGTENVSPEEINAFLEYYFQNVLPAKQALMNEVRQKEGEIFLANIETERGVQRSNSGLLYRIDKIGNNVRATDNDSVEVKYKGTKTTGEVFDQTPHGDDETATFTLSGVIKGFAEGLKLIGEGGKITLWIPADLGYGDAGPDPSMPLIFEVELIRVNP